MSYHYNNSISLKVYGRYALFSEPLTRVGGEKCSYPVPTYQALIGILEAMYWKPTFVWVIDDVRIMNHIETQSKGIRTKKMSKEGGSLSVYMYLTDVCYQVRAHFEWNDFRPDLLRDRNENKHNAIAHRMLERGGRRDIFLGARECQGYIEPCVFGTGKGAYDNIPSIPLGMMMHGFNYAGESTTGMLQERYWRPVMKNGVVHFLRPDECTIVRDIRPQAAEKFELGKNVQSCDELYDEVMAYEENMG